MVLICDICRQDISSTGGLNPSICLFPCFHKYCDRCKSQTLSIARQQHLDTNRVTCKLCNQIFPLNVLYDYSENQIEKIFCLHCNIKNKSPVEWSCKTCQNRFLCTQCSQPHYHSGHELEPVKKQNIPLRSQCHSHMNVPATHICSCQMRLCDYCLTIHANGQISNEHQQRIPFTRLAEQARMDLETMRKQSKLDAERIQRFSETLARNKQSIHQQANQARTAVANEMVELVNALIRRGNDIVTYIDMIEESKLKQSTQLENEMRHWMDRLRKIDSFTENALLTVQDDQPGLWSAAMFAQSAIIQVNKRRELAKQSIKNLERAPNIHYQSDISNLANSFRSFGIVNVDGEAKVPTQSTPQNARMFTISNAAQINPTSSVNVGTSRQVPPNATLRPSPLSIPNNTVNVSITLPQQQRQPMKLPANQLQPPYVANMPPLHTNLPVNSNSQSIAILPQLLQQPSMLNQPTAVSNCSVPSNSSLPSTPITPLPTPEQLQIMRQHAILAAQQQGPIPNIPTEQQQQAMFIQQKQRQERMAAAAQQQAQQSVTASQSHVQHHVQQQLRSPPIINPQQLPNQQQQYLQQLQLAQHQQMQQQSQQVHRIQQNQQRGPSTLLQQQSPMQLQMPRLNSPILQNAQNVETMPSERPPILLRIPNPRQQISQNLNISSESSSTTDMQHMPRMNTPPQNVTLTQILNSPGSQPTLSIPSRPLIGIGQPIATSTYPLVQGSSNQLQSQRPGSSIQQMEEKRIPDVVELLDDDEVDRESCQINDDKHKQNSIAITKRVEERCDDGKQPMNTNIIGATQSSTHQGILQNRQKAQSAAADSTVTSTSTPNNGSNDSRESVSPIDSATLTNRNGGIKRKIQEPAIMEPVSQKRQAVDEHRIVKYTNFDGNEAERTNMNTSPIVISSTTTTENGEMIVNENTTEIETESSVNLNDNSNDTRLEIATENTEENETKIENESETAIAAEDGNNTQTNTNKNDQISDDKGKETQHLQSSSENVLDENISRSREDITECDDGNGTTSSTENETIDSNDEDNLTEDLNSSIVIAHNKSNGQKSSTKCTIVSPIELMKMATSSHLNLSINQKERDNSQSTKKEAATKTTINESYKKGEDKNTSESKTDKEKNEEEFSNSVTNNSEGIPKLGDGSSDMWDDYCYVCSQGCDDSTGSLGCCETCPHVFHANCHLPKIKGKMEDLPDDWRCSMCIQCEPLNYLSQEYREREKLLCAKVYLACFEENNQVEVFLNEVPKTEVDYHAIIKKPVWLYAIANKVSDGAYNNISEFVDDMNLLFKNFSTFNPPNVMPLASYGKNVYSKYVSAMRKYLPAYQKQIWLYLSLYNHRLSNLSSGDEDQHQSGSRVGRPPKKFKAGPKSKSKSQTPI